MAAGNRGQVSEAGHFHCRVELIRYLGIVTQGDAGYEPARWGRKIGQNRIERRTNAGDDSCHAASLTGNLALPGAQECRFAPSCLWLQAPTGAEVLAGKCRAIELNSDSGPWADNDISV